MTKTFDLIATHPFLDGLAPQAVDRLSTVASLVRWRPSDRLFAEGGQADRFWLLIDGHVQLDTFLPGRGSVVIESLSDPAVMGWSWLFPPHRWRFGATAVTVTNAVEFDGIAVRRLCDSEPVLGYELIQRFTQVVIDRLQATRIRLLDLYRTP